MTSIALSTLYCQQRLTKSVIVRLEQRKTHFDRKLFKKEYYCQVCQGKQVQQTESKHVAKACFEPVILALSLLTSGH